FIVHRARKEPKRIVYPEGDNPKVLEAAGAVVADGIAHPILLGDEKKIRAAALRDDVRLDGVTIVDPERSDRLLDYASELYALRHRKGVTWESARKRAADPVVFAS